MRESSMNFTELLKKRQSVREYNTKKVDRSIIDECLEAARIAPSACNSQPWSFIIIDQPDLIDKVAECAFSGIYSMNAFAKEAPVLIGVITEKSKLTAKLGGQFRNTSYALIDVGIACEHLVLKAAEEGLGTCYIGWFNEKAVKKTLGIKKTKKMDLLISMGYPSSDEIKPKKRKNIDIIRSYSSHIMH